MNPLNRIKINYETNTVMFGLKRRRFKRIGQELRFGGMCDFNHTDNIEIGSYVFFGQYCYFDAISQIKIGSGCMFGPKVFCVAGSHNYSSHDLRAVPFDNRQLNRPVIIEDNVWIGGNVSIAPGTYIGEGSVIGMGAVVAGEIPPCSIVVARKALVIKNRNEKQYQILKNNEMIYGRVFAGRGFEMMEDCQA